MKEIEAYFDKYLDKYLVESFEKINVRIENDDGCAVIVVEGVTDPRTIGTGEKELLFRKFDLASVIRRSVMEIGDEINFLIHVAVSKAKTME